MRTEPECYEAGRVRYDLVAKSPLFLHGVERVRKGIESFRVALMCADFGRQHFPTVGALGNCGLSLTELKFNRLRCPRELL